jgi:hypothetical protein
MDRRADAPTGGRDLDDVVYELAVRRSIELGLADAEAGRVTEVREVRRTFRLSE